MSRTSRFFLSCLALALILLLTLLAACGGDADMEDRGHPQPTLQPESTTAADATPTPEPTATSTPEPTATPMSEPTTTPTPEPTATPMPEPTATPAPEPTATPTPAATPTEEEAHERRLALYADEYAGKPGAIYVGDLSQLAGPALQPELGGPDGGVSLDMLRRHSWIYESDYYRELLEKARLTDPTPLTSQGELIEIQFACFFSGNLPCQLLDAYFAPNVHARTNGQVRFGVSSYGELGASPGEVFFLVSDGTLRSASISGLWPFSSHPAFGINNLAGISSSWEESYQVVASVTGYLDRMVEESTDGGVVFSHNWLVGNDQFLFCRDAIELPEDFTGRKIRSNSHALSNWLRELGGEPVFLTLSEIHTALEKEILDCGVSSADVARSLNWHKAANYISGPIYSDAIVNTNVIGSGAWEEIPADLRRIILEEGAKLELEALRLTAAQNRAALTQLQDAGMEYIPFSPELQQLSRQAAMERVIPEWIRIVGDTSDPVITEIFNRKVGPIVGMRIEPDGTVTDLR